MFSKLSAVIYLIGVFTEKIERIVMYKIEIEKYRA